MPKKIIFKDYNTGEIVATRSIPKAEAYSVSFKFEYIGNNEYFVVRNYYTNEILHKFKRTPKMQRSLQFYCKNEY